MRWRWLNSDDGGREEDAADHGEAAIDRDDVVVSPEEVIVDCG